MSNFAKALIAFFVIILVIGLLIIGVLTSGFLDPEPEAIVLTATPSFTVTASITPSATSSATSTITPSPTPTYTPTFTPTPIPVPAIMTAINKEAFLETARGELRLPDVFATNDWPGSVDGGLEIHQGY